MTRSVPGVPDASRWEQGAPGPLPRRGFIHTLRRMNGAASEGIHGGRMAKGDPNRRWCLAVPLLVACAQAEPTGRAVSADGVYDAGVVTSACPVPEGNADGGRSWLVADDAAVEVERRDAATDAPPTHADWAVFAPVEVHSSVQRDGACMRWTDMPLPAATQLVSDGASLWVRTATELLQWRARMNFERKLTLPSGWRWVDVVGGGGAVVGNVTRADPASVDDTVVIVRDGAQWRRLEGTVGRCARVDGADLYLRDARGQVTRRGPDGAVAVGAPLGDSPTFEVLGRRDALWIVRRDSVHRCAGASCAAVSMPPATRLRGAAAAGAAPLLIGDDALWTVRDGAVSPLAPPAGCVASSAQRWAGSASAAWVSLTCDGAPRMYQYDDRGWTERPPPDERLFAPDFMAGFDDGRVYVWLLAYGEFLEQHPRTWTWSVRYNRGSPQSSFSGFSPAPRVALRDGEVAVLNGDGEWEVLDGAPVNAMQVFALADGGLLAQDGRGGLWLRADGVWRLLPHPDVSPIDGELMARTSQDIWIADYDFEGTDQRRRIQHWDGYRWRSLPQAPCAIYVGTWSPVGAQGRAVLRCLSGSLATMRFDGRRWRPVLGIPPGNFVTFVTPRGFEFEVQHIEMRDTIKYPVHIEDRYAADGCRWISDTGRSFAILSTSFGSDLLIPARGLRTWHQSPYELLLVGDRESFDVGAAERLLWSDGNVFLSATRAVRETHSLCHIASLGGAP